jgi:hypothetical protein
LLLVLDTSPGYLCACYNLTRATLLPISPIISEELALQIWSITQVKFDKIVPWKKVSSLKQVFVFSIDFVDSSKVTKVRS